MEIMILCIIGIGAFIYFRSAGKHLDQMSGNYRKTDSGN